MTFNNGISIIGTGNVAWHMAHKFKGAGLAINVVVGRNLQKAKQIAFETDAQYSDSVTSIPDNSELVLICVSDFSIREFAEKLIDSNLPIAHTAASVPLSVFETNCKLKGVFYPFQTFTKGVRKYVVEFPIGIEAFSEEMYLRLEELGKLVSKRVFRIDSEKRKILHISGVMANNFSNFLFNNAYKLLESNSLDSSLLIPIIRETVLKLESDHPCNLQTGPAYRGSSAIINEHLSALKQQDNFYNLYKFMSEEIVNFYKINNE